MFNVPARVADLGLQDALAEMMRDRDRDPFHAARGFDFVPIAPVILRVLQIVMENEEIGVVDEIEIALPGKVI